MRPRRTQGLGAYIAPLVAFALLAGTVAFGWAASLSHQADQHAASPAATATSDHWTQQIDTARTELEANTTALHAAHLTRQPINRLTQQCQTAAGLYNQAAAHLSLDPINPSKECTP